MAKLTIKQKKFVANKAKGMTNHAAYVAAGYSATSNKIARVNSAKLKTKPHIQEAIDEALTLLGATPEAAIRELWKVAQQDDELGAKRLANKDILELHGFKKNQAPNNVLAIENAFFTQTRKNIDATDSDQQED